VSLRWKAAILRKQVGRVHSGPCASIELVRCAIVTGGGTGIGAAVARRLHRDGNGIVLVGRRREPLEEVARDLDEVLVVEADAGDAGDVERALSGAVERFGGVDVLVNNAGVGDSAPVLEETLECWERTLRINLTGAFLMARATLPSLIERRGSIVNVSSINAFLAGPGWASYCTSKAGLVMLTRSLAVDYGPVGVRANCVCPGWVRTPMGEEDMTRVANLHGTDVEGAYRLAHQGHPLARPAEPDEIAAAVSFLASSDASYVNGVALPVDGGTTSIDPTALAFR
jgi:meso-butanediol dehydrogenase/(S,S)-butanediol dehydrogenase/diacetyl reductase